MLGADGVVVRAEVRLDAADGIGLEFSSKLVTKPSMMTNRCAILSRPMRTVLIFAAATAGAALRISSNTPLRVSPPPSMRYIEPAPPAGFEWATFDDAVVPSPREAVVQGFAACDRVFAKQLPNAVAGVTDVCKDGLAGANTAVASLTTASFTSLSVPAKRAIAVAVTLVNKVGARTAGLVLAPCLVGCVSPDALGLALKGAWRLGAAAVLYQVIIRASEMPWRRVLAMSEIDFPGIEVETEWHGRGISPLGRFSKVGATVSTPSPAHA